MLNDKVVLITGAKGGLGTHVTQAFLDAGARVVGSSRSIRDGDFAHSRFSAEPAEIGSAEQAGALVARVTGKLGRIDALVHLVGGFTGGATVEETEEDAWARMLEMNLYSFLRMARAVLPGMRQRGEGSILAIGSRTAIEPAGKLSAYNASKAALVTLVRTIAIENRHTGISANVILPATMDTGANRVAMPKADASKWVQPSQVAALLVHLASPSARQITGAAIPVFGSEL